ncbi:MAG: hypothetical protein JXB88_17815 [Spirochaetales bacterium]|nr:hypothetical protein [Spirochaetales bacterium]
MGFKQNKLLLEACENCGIIDSNCGIITTPAGIFQHVYGKSGSTSTQYSFENENISISIHEVQSGTMFYHTALPMNGIVGWKSDKDNAEVVDFGFDGAVPAVPLE